VLQGAEAFRPTSGNRRSLSATLRSSLRSAFPRRTWICPGRRVATTRV